jgi:hypothetical protein
MKVKIIFVSSNAEKVFENALAVYTKAGLLCIEDGDDIEDGQPMICKYPLVNVFSVCHRHGNHWGSKKCCSLSEATTSAKTML